MYLAADSSVSDCDSRHARCAKWLRLRWLQADALAAGGRLLEATLLRAQQQDANAEAEQLDLHAQQHRTTASVLRGQLAAAETKDAESTTQLHALEAVIQQLTRQRRTGRLRDAWREELSAALHRRQQADERAAALSADAAALRRKAIELEEHAKQREGNGTAADAEEPHAQAAAVRPRHAAAASAAEAAHSAAAEAKAQHDRVQAKLDESQSDRERTILLQQQLAAERNLLEAADAARQRSAQAGRAEAAQRSKGEEKRREIAQLEASVRTAADDASHLRQVGKHMEAATLLRRVDAVQAEVAALQHDMASIDSAAEQARKQGECETADAARLDLEAAAMRTMHGHTQHALLCMCRIRASADTAAAAKAASVKVRAMLTCNGSSCVTSSYQNPGRTVQVPVHALRLSPTAKLGAALAIDVAVCLQVRAAHAALTATLDANLQAVGAAEAVLAACKADSACSQQQLRDAAHRAADARLAHDTAEADASAAALAVFKADVHAHQCEQGVAQAFPSSLM